MSRAKRADVIKKAESLGLCCDYYNPGDGLTRYRFFGQVRLSLGMGQSIAEKPDYFSGSGLGTVLGAKQAMLWLDGFEAGYKQGKEEK